MAAPVRATAAAQHLPLHTLQTGRQAAWSQSVEKETDLLVGKQIRSVYLKVANHVADNRREEW